MVNLPTTQQADEANAFMVNEVYVPAFLEKLAQHNLSPNNDAEVRQMLQLGHMLSEAEANGQHKAASTAPEGNPYLASAIDKLQYDTPVTKEANAAYVQQQAVELVKSSEVALNAATIYAHTLGGGELAPTEQPAAEAVAS